MVVIKVSRKGNNVYVHFDNDQQMAIPYDVFLKNYLSVNDVISEKIISELEIKVELYKIKQSSFRYLSGRNHSKYELQRKLLKKNYKRTLIESVLHDLERQQLINDVEFANLYFSSQLRKKWGLLKIKADLFKKGVNREIIEETIRRHEDDNVFLESAKAVATKKYSLLLKRNLNNNKINQKIYQFLMSRGFTSNIIIETIKHLELENRDV